MNSLKQNTNKYLLILYFLIVFLISLVPIKISIDLINMKDYHDVQTFLTNPTTNFSLLIRSIVASLNINSFTVLNFIKNIFLNLNIADIGLIVLLIYLMAARKEKSLKCYISYLDLFLAIDGTLISLQLVVFSTGLLHSVTFDDAINSLNLFGYLLLVQNIIVIIISVLFSYLIFKDKKII